MNSVSEKLCLQYKTQSGYKLLFLSLSAILLAGTVIAGISVGASGLSPAEIVTSLFKDTGRSHSIVWMLRVPRVLMACLVGFGLGLAGTVFQAVLRNPLASPFTLGIGSGAGFGAVTVILFLGGGFHICRVAAGAFVFCRPFSLSDSRCVQNEAGIFRDHDPDRHCPDVSFLIPHVPVSVHGDHGAGSRSGVLVFWQSFKGGLA